MTNQRPIHVDDEARVTEMARELDALATETHAMPSTGFADRVMASIAREPLPQPARAFTTALAARRLGAALASVGDAWRIVVGGRVPLAVRAEAFALVLVVAAGSVALAGGATVGAIDLLNASQPTQPSPTEPRPQASPSPSPTPTVTTPKASTSPAPTEDATETPEATDNAGATSGSDAVTPRPTRTEDVGGGSGGGEATSTPTATNDGGGSGGDNQTPSPTATGTDDHGGGSGGDG